MLKRIALLSLFAFCGAYGCGSSDDTSSPNPSLDGGLDSSSDASSDSASNHDALPEASADSEPDASPEASSEDSGPVDSAAEASLEDSSSTDSSQDAPELPDASPESGPDASAPSWSVIPAIETNNYKSRAAISVGPDAKPRLVYNQATEGDGWYKPAIYYAILEGSSWQSTLAVDANGVSREFPTLVIDSQNQPSIVYNANIPAQNQIDIFVVKANAAGVFSQPINVTNSTAADDFGPASAIDSQNRVHVIFQTKTGSAGAYQYKIGYARITDGQAPLLEELTGNAAQFSLDPEYSLAVDGQGNVHAVYCKPGTNTLNNVLYYRMRSASGWGEEEPVTELDQDVWGPSVAVDSAGTVHVAYVKSPTWDVKTLRYNRRQGGHWGTEQTLSGSTEDRSYYLGLRVDSTQTVHLGFARFDSNSNGDILYLSGTNGVFSSEEYLTQTPSMDEQSPSMAIGPTGTLYLSFLENLSTAPNGRVFVATRPSAR